MKQGREHLANQTAPTMGDPTEPIWQGDSLGQKLGEAEGNGSGVRLLGSNISQQCGPEQVKLASQFPNRDNTQ